MLIRLAPLIPLALLGCQEQPSTAVSNAETSAQLTAISANISETAGQGVSPQQSTPTVGQTLDAEPQPPKKQ
jgi:hypothetical protein